MQVKILIITLILGIFLYLPALAYEAIDYQGFWYQTAEEIPAHTQVRVDLAVADPANDNADIILYGPNGTLMDHKNDLTVGYVQASSSDSGFWQLRVLMHVDGNFPNSFSLDFGEQIWLEVDKNQFSLTVAETLWFSISVEEPSVVGCDITTEDKAAQLSATLFSPTGEKKAESFTGDYHAGVKFTPAETGIWWIRIQAKAVPSNQVNIIASFSHQSVVQNASSLVSLTDGQAYWYAIEVTESGLVAVSFSTPYFIDEVSLYLYGPDGIIDLYHIPNANSAEVLFPTTQTGTWRFCTQAEDIFSTPSPGYLAINYPQMTEQYHNYQTVVDKQALWFKISAIKPSIVGINASTPNTVDQINIWLYDAQGILKDADTGASNWAEVQTTSTGAENYFALIEAIKLQTTNSLDLFTSISLSEVSYYPPTTIFFSNGQTLWFSDLVEEAGVVGATLVSENNSDKVQLTLFDAAGNILSNDGSNEPYARVQTTSDQAEQWKIRATLNYSFVPNSNLRLQATDNLSILPSVQVLSSSTNSEFHYELKVENIGIVRADVSTPKNTDDVEISIYDFWGNLRDQDNSGNNTASVLTNVIQAGVMQIIFKAKYISDSIPIALMASSSETLITNPLNFDAPEYDLDDYAFLTLEAYTENRSSTIEEVTIHINSTTDLAGIKLTLSETGASTGIFTGLVLISEQASQEEVRIQASSDDTLTASYQKGTYLPHETTALVGCGLKGDLDGDLQVSPADALAALTIYLEVFDGDGDGLPDQNQPQPGSCIFFNADYCPYPDGDDAVLPEDALGILKSYLGIEPACE